MDSKREKEEKRMEMREQRLGEVSPHNISSVSQKLKSYLQVFKVLVGSSEFVEACHKPFPRTTYEFPHSVKLCGFRQTTSHAWAEHSHLVQRVQR